MTFIIKAIYKYLSRVQCGKEYKLFIESLPYEIYSPCTFNNTNPKINPNKINAELIKATVKISSPIFLQFLN